MISIEQAMLVLSTDKSHKFSLLEIKVPFTDGSGYLVAYYHIFDGHLPGMIHVIGTELMEYV